MCYGVGTKIQGQGKYRHKKLIILSFSDRGCKVKSLCGKESGRVHYMSSYVIERFYTPCGK